MEGYGAVLRGLEAIDRLSLALQRDGLSDADHSPYVRAMESSVFRQACAAVTAAAQDVAATPGFSVAAARTRPAPFAACGVHGASAYGIVRFMLLECAAVIAEGCAQSDEGKLFARLKGIMGRRTGGYCKELFDALYAGVQWEAANMVDAPAGSGQDAAAAGGGKSKPGRPDQEEMNLRARDLGVAPHDERTGPQNGKEKKRRRRKVDPAAQQRRDERAKRQASERILYNRWLEHGKPGSGKYQTFAELAKADGTTLEAVQNAYNNCRMRDGRPP